MDKPAIPPAVDISVQTVREILEHRLRQADIEALLKTLDEPAKAQLFYRIGELVRRTSALVEVANRVSDTLSLDALFPKLMAVVSETINAERSTLFLYDTDADELFSRVVQGDGVNEIRIAAGAGIAGSVFKSGQARIIADAYADPRFNRDVDVRTGYRTRNILCSPIRNKQHQVIGVTQVLNKKEGEFDDEDARLLESLSTQAAAALENAQLFEKIERAQREEALLLEVTNAIGSELKLDPLLIKVIAAATGLLDADRGTLFLHDPRTDELVSRVAEGVSVRELRIPAGAGIAGECFRTGAPINIPEAYADARFNPEVDRRTHYRTSSLLAMPISAREGNKVGVIQMLNKKHGPFSAHDERRLRSFCSQIAMALENARLFEEVNAARVFNESILKSLSSGIIALDAQGRVNKVNEAACVILKRAESELAGRDVAEVFAGRNAWVVRSVDKVRDQRRPDISIDTDLALRDGAAASVNMTVVPHYDLEGSSIGYMLAFEDITREKRIRNTMSRYMSKTVVDSLLESGEAALGGTGREVSVLFSDIRGFTAITEQLGARETVAMLNEYFTDMVDIVFAHNGILDKYIGDCIMAVFGSVLTSAQDPDNAVTVAIRMMEALKALNLRRTASGRGAIQVGVGISTGDVVAGNIGSPKRMEFTVIGDRVNLAQRLEGATKYYGSRILISDVTAARLKQRRVLREIDLIRLRGRREPVAIFEVLDHTDAGTFPNREQVLEAYAAGLRAYRSREWGAAGTFFRQALAANPADIPSALYAERCRLYLDTPPPHDWDGVWILDD